MVKETKTRAERRARWSALAEQTGSGILFLALPIITFLATRSAPLMLVLATVSMGFATIAGGRFHRFREILARAGKSPLAAVLAVFVVFMLASVLWSPDAMLSLKTALRTVSGFGLVVVAGAAFVTMAPARRVSLLTIGVPVGAALCLVQLHAGFSIRGLFGGNDYDYAINRAVMTQSLLVWPLAAWWFCHGRRLLALALIAVVAVTAFSSDSGAAALSMIVGMLALVVAALWRRLALGATISVVLVTALMAPWLARSAYASLPAWFHQGLAGSHSAERTVAWNDFAQAVFVHFWSGWGMNASRALPLSSISDPSRTISQVWWHPHNALLQVWVEFGFAGAALVAAATLLGVRVIAALPQRVFPFAIAAFSGAYAASSISHGAWEHWWHALVGATIIAFSLLMKEAPGEITKPAGQTASSITAMP